MTANVAIERGMFRRNPVAWFEKYGRINSKEVGQDPNKAPSANWLQEQVGQAIRWFVMAKKPIRLILYKGRQRGSSTVVVACVYVLSRIQPMNVLVLGGQASQTNNLWKILRHYGRKDTYDWGNTWEANQETAKCSNGTLWERETAGDKDAGRSGNYHAVIITELARWPTDGAKNAGDVMNSVLECVGEGEGTIVALDSTAKGPAGPFPDTWRDAVTLDEAKSGKSGNGYVKIFAPWYVFPSRESLEPGEESHLEDRLRSKDRKALLIRDRHKLSWEQIKWYHQKLMSASCNGDPVKRDREHPTTPEDGFQASEASRFAKTGLDWLEEMAQAAATPKEGESKLIYGKLTMDNGAFKPRILPLCHDDPECDIVQFEPPKHMCRYIIPIDNCKGRLTTKGADIDKNAALVIRDGYYGPDNIWHPPAIAAALMPNNEWEYYQLAEWVALAAKMYGNCMTAPENNRGEGVLHELRQRGVLIIQEPRSSVEIDINKTSLDYGWNTTESSKKAMISELARRIYEPNAIGAGIAVHIMHVIKELRTFVRHDNGTEGAMKVTGCHDDFVLALAIGIACLPSATSYVDPNLVRRDADSPRSGPW